MLDMWQRSSQEGFPLYQGGRPQIYSAQEAYIVGDVGHNIPHIYVDVDNIQVDHQASNISNGQ